MEWDKRPAKDQIKSGLLIAGQIVFAFLVLVLASGGFRLMHSFERPFHFPGPLRAWAALFLSVIVIFLTAEKWLVIAGLIIARGSIAGLFYLLFPVAGATNARGLNRLQAAEPLVYSILLLPLVWRFIPPRKYRATVLDRVAITSFVLSAVALISLPEEAHFQAAIFGIFALSVAWMASLWRQHHVARNKPAS